MRVCVISTPIFKLPLTGYGGLEAIAWETARGLAARGHEVALVAPDGSECPGVQIIPCGPAGQVDEKMAYSGFPEAKDQQGNVLRRQHAGYWSALLSFDVVIDSSWMKWAYELKAEGVLKAPVLGVFHAPVNTMYQMWPPNFPLKPVVEKACPVCISHDQAEHFQSIHNRLARVAYNGVDVDNFYVPLPGVKRTDRFLFLARFSTVKSPHLAIEACLKAGVGLDLVGDTSITNEPQYFEQCMQMARQQSPGWDATKGQQIVVHGGCTRGETVIWYNKAHALIHPTQNFREPFGLAPVEAAACGCPVIAWNYGAVKETVVNHTTGILVDSIDELVGAVQTEWIRRVSPSHRLDCREHAKRFSLEKMVDGYEKLIHEAVTTGGW
jgi:glycosyltransferase involved in cell wall biosynthesis